MKLRSIAGAATYPANSTRLYDEDGGLLEVELDIPELSPQIFDERLSAQAPLVKSGVWRYRELMPTFPNEVIVTKPEGNTNLYHDQRLDDFAGTEVHFKHEGENPTGSFKDRGMTAGLSHARWTGASVVACASTGNTSASVASYAAAAGLPSLVFLPEGKISVAKLAQTVAYGARIVQVRGDFDAAMQLVREATERFDLYLLNSLNPFRLEGQKSIFFEALQQLNWQPPDWVVVPGGNLGNASALGKAIREALQSGLITTVPRIAVIQASGAAPFYRAFNARFEAYQPVAAHTVASAIQIGNPVNYSKARRAIMDTEGIVCAVNDQQILDAKARIDRVGIGCEPASAAGLAGIRQLVASGAIQPGERIVTYITGHLLKDTDAIADYHLTDNPGRLANRPIVIDANLAALESVMSDVI